MAKPATIGHSVEVVKTLHCYHACMSATLTIRVDDELAELARDRAREQGISMNQYATNLLRAALDPMTSGDLVESLRERLRRAGLDVPRPTVPSGSTRRPAADVVADAMRTAGRGRALSDIVSDGRG
jgi:HicB family